MLRSYSSERTSGGGLVPRRRWDDLFFLGGLGACILLLVISEFIWR